MEESKNAQGLQQEQKKSDERGLKQNKIQIQFLMVQKNWPFIHFVESFKKTDPFLLIEDRIKRRHGCIKNLQLYYEPSLKRKIEYSFKDPLESNMQLFSLSLGQKDTKIMLYYRYDNGYEWPLLCS